MPDVPLPAYMEASPHELDAIEAMAAGGEAYAHRALVEKHALHTEQVPPVKHACGGRQAPGPGGGIAAETGG